MAVYYLRQQEEAGGRIVYQDLARTMKKLAAEGADIFYHGEIALKPAYDSKFAHVQAIRFDQESGLKVGGSEPRTHGGPGLLRKHEPKGKARKGGRHDLE